MRKLRDLKDYFELHMEDKDTLKMKQDILRQIDGHKTIIHFLKEGSVVYDILVEIMKNPH